MNRLERIAAATETLKIIERGQYQNRLGETVQIGDAVEMAVRESRLLAPGDFPALLAEREKDKPPYDFLQLALLPSDRSVLHERIARRFDEMLLGGLDDEVRRLRARLPELHVSR